MSQRHSFATKSESIHSKKPRYCWVAHIENQEHWQIAGWHRSTAGWSNEWLSSRVYCLHWLEHTRGTNNQLVITFIVFFFLRGKGVGCERGGGQKAWGNEKERDDGGVW